MFTMVKDRSYCIYPATPVQMNYMLSRFEMQVYSKSLSVIDTVYYTENGKRYFKNKVTVYAKVEDNGEEDRAG